MQSLPRYLIFFQYIGTKYSGVVREPVHRQVKGVQNYLEDALRRLKPVNPVSLHVSSRTDSGVHALSNSAHFDIQRRNEMPPFTGDMLVEALNFYLKEEAIRVTRAYRVSPEFHARYCAQGRTYLYRVALGVSNPYQLPLVDDKLCWGLRNTELDLGAMRDAAALLVGTQDFSSFRAINSDTALKSPVKTLEVASIEPGEAFSRTHFHRDVPFWEFTFKSKSFLYKQVRRMTGALVAVGQGKLSVLQLKELLEAKDSLAFPQGTVAPADGLFLLRVDYREAGKIDSYRLQ